MEVLACLVHWCSPKTATKTNNAENDGHKHTGSNASNHSAAPVINEEHGTKMLIYIHILNLKNIHVHSLREVGQEKRLDGKQTLKE